MIRETDDGKAWVSFEAMLGKVQNMVDGGWKFDGQGGRETLAAAALLMGLRGAWVRVTIEELARPEGDE